MKRFAPILLVLLCVGLAIDDTRWIIWAVDGEWVAAAAPD